MVKEIDATDRRILAALLENGRLSNNALAEQIALSQSPCWQRTRRLEEDGYIKGYSVILDHTLLGIAETVVLEVSLDRHDDSVVESFGEIVSKMPEVLQLYLTTGDFDYLVIVATNGTISYERFLREKMYKIPGVKHCKSSFTLRCLKRRMSLVPEVSQ